MTKVVIDAAVRAKLDDLQEPVELCDESGRTLGYFHPKFGESKTRDREAGSPFTDAEIERRQQQRTGRPLKEILKDLERS